MALNNMGVGFNFYGRDSGLGKAIGSAKSGFTGLVGAAKDVTVATGKGMVSALVQSQSGLANASTEMRVFTTDIEAQGIASRRTAHQVLSGLNMTTKAANKAAGQIAGIAYSTTIDARQLSTEFAALYKQGIDVSKIGFKSFTNFAKYIEVTGVNAEELVAQIGYMKNQLGMSEGQIKKFLEQQDVLGKHFNFGNEALGNMSKALAVVRKEGAAMWASLPAERQLAYAKGTNIVAGALIKLGNTSDDAASSALKLTETLVKSQQEFVGLYTGLKDDLSGLGVVLTQELGKGPQQAWDIINKKPEVFVAGLADAFAQAKQLGKGEDLLLKITNRLSAGLGDNLTHQLVELMRSGTAPTLDQLKQLEAQLNQSDGALNKHAAALKSPFTPAQEYQRILDRLHQSLKNVAGISDTKFNRAVEASSKQLVSLLGQLQDPKKGVPGFAKFFRFAMQTAEHGLGGLMGEIDPAFMQMNLLQQRLGGVAGAVIGFGVAMMNLGKDKGNFAKRIEIWKQKFQEFGAGASEFMKNFVTGIRAFYPIVRDAIKTLFLQVYNGFFDEDKAGTAGEALDKLFTHAFNYIKEQAPKWWATFKSVLLAIYKGISGDETANNLGDAFSNMWAKAKPAIWKGIKSFVGWLLDVIWEGLKELPGLLLRSLVGAFNGIRTWLGGVDISKMVKNKQDTTAIDNWTKLSEQYFNARKAGNIEAQKSLYEKVVAAADKANINLRPPPPELMPTATTPTAVPAGPRASVQGDEQRQAVASTNKVAGLLQSIDTKHDRMIDGIDRLNKNLEAVLTRRGSVVSPDGTLNTSAGRPT